MKMIKPIITANFCSVVGQKRAFFNYGRGAAKCSYCLEEGRKSYVIFFMNDIDEDKYQKLIAFLVTEAIDKKYVLLTFA